MGPANSQGLRRIATTNLPTDLRARPSTRLAFEFLDQPFLLDLGVEPSPPLVRADSKTLFRIEQDQARSETTIELRWVHGRLFEMEFGVAAGLQVISVGPPEVVENSHLTTEISGATHRDLNGVASRLGIRLAPLGRDQNKVVLRLIGQQRIPREGSIKLGLFTLDETIPVHASYALAAERDLALELEDDSGRLRRASETTSGSGGPPIEWPWTSPRRRPAQGRSCWWVTEIPGLCHSGSRVRRDRYPRKRS